MKFILNEKYILAEKFILNEATQEEMNELQKFLNKVSAAYKEVLNNATDLRKNNEFLNKLSTAKENADKAVNDAKLPYETMREWVLQYVEAFENGLNEQKDSIDINNSNFTELNKLIRQITSSSDYDKGVTGEEASRTNLKNNYEKLSSSIEKIFYLGGQTAHNNINKEITDLTDSFENLKAAIEVIKNNKVLELLPDNQITTFLQNLNTFLPLTDEKLLNTDTEKYFDTCIENLIKITELLNKLVTDANISKEQADKAVRDAESANERANSEKQDWAARYKKCKTTADFNKFWKDYFTIEWGKNAKKIDALGIVFTNELEQLGFDSINNPFIKFLKEDNRIDKFNITKDTYTELHNAVARNILELKDLTGNGKFKQANLIFNPQLFSTYSDDFTEYLLAQQKLRREFTDLPDNIKNAGEVTVLNNLMLNDGNINNLADDSINTKNSTDLRPITVINQILTQLFGASKTETSGSEILKKLDSVSIDGLKKVIAFMLSYFQQEFPNIIKSFIENKDNAIIIKDLDNINLTIKDRLNYENELGLKYNTLNGKEFQNLLNGISAKILGK